MNRAYKMEPWALGADLNFLSVIFFLHQPLHSFSVFFPPSLALPPFLLLRHYPC